MSGRTLRFLWLLFLHIPDFERILRRVQNIPDANFWKGSASRTSTVEVYHIIGITGVHSFIMLAVDFPPLYIGSTLILRFFLYIGYTLIWVNYNDLTDLLHWNHGFYREIIPFYGPTIQVREIL